MNLHPLRAVKAVALFTILLAIDLFTKSIAVNALQGGIHFPLIPGVLEFSKIEAPLLVFFRTVR